MNISILRFDSLPSTNTEAVSQARRGAGEGVCVIADEQTAGKGRQGRSWISEKGAGAYMSLILRPRLDAKDLSLITLAAAVAVYEVLAKGFLIEPDIKWPNDVHVGGRKICGILAEAVETPQGPAVILGIGINIRSPADPNATSIAEETSFRTTRDEVVEAVLSEFAKLYETLHSEPAKVIEMMAQRSTYASGCDVTVTLPSGRIRGTTDGLDETGALRIRLEDGTVSVVHAGDVERVRRGAAE